MMSPHEKMLVDLERQGLITRATDGTTMVTPEGDAYTRALIAAYPNIDKAGLTKRRRRHD